MKLPLPQITVAFAITLPLIGFTSVQTQAIERAILVQNPTFGLSRQFNKPIIFNAPPPPEDIGAPGNRTAGGKRGCFNLNSELARASEKQLTALVPNYRQKDSRLVLGFTTASHPTFWFYVPYRPTINAQFVLQDETQKFMYQTSISVSKTPGVISVSLPSTARPLEAGKRYRWYFNIYCQPQQPPIFIQGWIQRNLLNPALQNRLEKATLQEQATIYASNGYWYDALTAVAELRRRDPRDTKWNELLQAVDLTDVAEEPLVECCGSGN